MTMEVHLNKDLNLVLTSRPFQGTPQGGILTPQTQ